MIPANWLSCSKARRVTLAEVQDLDGVYDIWVPAELTSMFTTSGGAVNCVADDPVGRMESLKTASTRHFIQATAGARPTLKLSGSNYYLQFDASDDSMAVSSSTALYKFLHDCTGGYIMAAVSVGSSLDPDGDYMILTTSGDYSPNVGFSCLYDDRVITSRNNRLVCRTSRGVTSEYAYILISDDDGFPPTTPVVVEYGPGTNGATQKIDAAETSTSLKLYTESTASSTYNLTMGFNPYTSSYADLKFYGAVVFNKTPTDFSIRRARRYLGQLSGVVFPS